MLRVCLLSAVLETSCDAGDCSLLLYMGFSGDDRDNVAFQTGYQISQVNQYSRLESWCARKHAVGTTGVRWECVKLCILSGLHTEFPMAYGVQVSNVLNNAQTGYIGGEAPPTSASGDVA